MSFSSQINISIRRCVISATVSVTIACLLLEELVDLLGFSDKVASRVSRMMCNAKNIKWIPVLQLKTHCCWEGSARMTRSLWPWWVENNLIYNLHMSNLEKKGPTNPILMFDLKPEAFGYVNITSLIDSFRFFCSDQICQSWLFTFIIIRDLYLTVPPKRYTCTLVCFCINHLRHQQKNICEMTRGIKIGKMDTLIAHVSSTFSSGGQQRVCQLKLSSIVVLPTASVLIICSTLKKHVNATRRA